MLRVVKRPQSELSCSQTASILVKGIYGVLSMNDENGCAYGIPLRYVYVVNSIYFRCPSDSRELQLIRNNNKVGFCVVGTGSFNHAIVLGTAVEVDDHEEKFKVLVTFVEKYAGKHRETGLESVVRNGHETRVIRLDIEHLLGRAAGQDHL